MPLFRLAGGLALFMYGIKIMSDALQRTAGKRLQAAIGFMTANRFAAVLSGLVVTAIVQSSSAVSVIVVSFVSAQLLTLTQAIGVIMGANIGTTFTAWIVAAFGFSVDISVFALPAVAVGFILRSIKWKQPVVAVGLGEVLLGAGLLFLGLEFMTNAIPPVEAKDVAKILTLSNYGVLSIVIGVLIGAVVTAAMNSSSATIAIIITLAHNGVINFEMACAMTLGANIGTTVDAPLAAIGVGSGAMRAALVHVLFNTIGSVICICLFRPILFIVDKLVPGIPNGEFITLHISAFHTVFNVLSTLIFLPFVNQYAAFISFLVKDKRSDGRVPYMLDTPRIVDSPELSIVRAGKEIRDLAALVFTMYRKLRAGLDDMSPGNVEALTKDLQNDESYADVMREELTGFLMQITRAQLNSKSEHNVALFLRIVADLEDMTDDCYSIGLLLLRNAQKERHFKGEEKDGLIVYMSRIENFLSFVREHMGGKLSQGEAARARKLESEIDENRNELRKLAQRRIESGQNVKTELAYIDLVRRLERLGDFCNGISSALSEMA
ncbi:MAG: Na/Pi symporter [Spirochaetaceae bacterium]|jgi:phosphate:Na+ symporter|nr:Na/Pi symporter [Spirochaetaceae bacterium]